MPRHRNPPHQRERAKAEHNHHRVCARKQRRRAEAASGVRRRGGAGRAWPRRTLCSRTARGAQFMVNLFTGQAVGQKKKRLVQKSQMKAAHAMGKLSQPLL